MSNVESRTLRFFLGLVSKHLREEIDWRARGRGRFVVARAAIYAAAMARDLLRIPLHHRDGIGQARFRARISYITGTALPTIRFFLDVYRMDPQLQAKLDAASEKLKEAELLLSDGRIAQLDEWYATMNEFASLQAICAEAASMIDGALEIL